ncbi:MAG: DEAD/DEAH box helicase [Bacteroidetes bacterium]|nr:MAG: DEAD/DEAH box helicase [Bacteroidota bacterium]
MSFSPGALVRARGREWVVLPDSTDTLLLLRPLGGTDEEVVGIHQVLEDIEPAKFELPNPEQVGDYRSARMLRDAVKLGFRSSAGPFRSFAKIAVEPRPYQLVPLLMALKLEPIRLLIADDVGIGKTIEAGLIARELLDRGEIKRIGVLCPPQLAEQWQAELHDKFHIDAVLVLPGTIAKLERKRRIRIGESLFDHYPFVVVSTDFIKSDRRRDEFLRTAPEFIIIDEAHTVVNATEGRGSKHLRHQLVSGLAKDTSRHLVLVTATPHSGNESAFRSLLTLLKADFADLPDDLSGKQHEHFRRDLAQHFVQRRRADIRAYLESSTPFPEREYGEVAYKLSDDYKRLFDRALRYAHEIIKTPGETYQQRVRWWSVLALLSSMASSPAAAAATLRSRAATIDARTIEEIDEIGRHTVLDLMDDEVSEGIDIIPGSDASDLSEDKDTERRRLLEMARDAEALMGKKDRKLHQSVEIVRELLSMGYSPIMFCRFIPTVEYVTAELRKSLPGVEITGVTGLLPSSEREERVALLSRSEQRVLVCTDCLSEGINLQRDFNAIIHYDLSWNPTRHEQREGRIDRYGQPRSSVKVVTYYGIDNQIDGVILDVLLRKHKSIRDSLGISVPLPGDISQVVEAIFEGLLLRESSSYSPLQPLLFPEDMLLPQKNELSLQWEAVQEREKRSRTMFAQQTIRVDEVRQELEEARRAVGSGIDVTEFVTDTIRMYGGFVSMNGAFEFDLHETPRGLRQAVGNLEKFKARFELPVKSDQIYLTRTHPIVEGLANYVMNTALDTEVDEEEAVARRSGALRTMQVEKRTTLLLLRFRYHIITKRGNTEYPLLTEDSLVACFEGSPENAKWLSSEEAERLILIKLSQEDENIHPLQAAGFIKKVIDGFGSLSPQLDDIAHRRGAELLEAHQRVRAASKMSGVHYTIVPQLPPDVLGVYIFLPARGK